MENCLEFSSPLGDGLVQNIESKKDTLENFRPRVGMGWFLSKAREKLKYSCFRPRLGMGWFRKKVDDNSLCGCFRPRVGMGWFQLKSVLSAAGTRCHFRPRVGMGWFLNS